MSVAVVGSDQDSATVVRRFRLFNVGIAKTGTTSIAAIFERYRSGHEFQFEEAVRTISRWTAGEITFEQLRKFVLDRDRVGGLEVDSASFNHHFIDILVEEFPAARFVLTVRDCFSWFNSIVNMGLQSEGEVPAWMMEYGHFLASGQVEDGALQSRLDVVAALPDMLDGLFRYWRETNEGLLERLPAERMLILRTFEISRSVDRLALFTGVPRESLRTRASHRNKAHRRLDVLKSLDPQLVEDRYERHCKPLMERLFPNFKGGSQ